ncbi:MAG: hypothetical protein IPH07_26250 [Deltaproteobacteria bacterium]|nr:hypothetical protein [Deltaproteobacteria bacterium]MBK8718264.1 hypothetical protein [Deltaproteobacteria bacterium]MBP7291088.1 hypothetical protein [Nannocystaceae bacterium]
MVFANNYEFLYGTGDVMACDVSAWPASIRRCPRPRSSATSWCGSTRST